MTDETGYFDEERIRKLLSGLGIIVGDIKLDDEDYTAEVFVEVSSAILYSSSEIMNIVKKIDRLETMLVMQGFIQDIKFGDIYQGNWRIIIHFLNEEEIEKWEDEAIKQ